MSKLRLLVRRCLVKATSTLNQFRLWWVEAPKGELAAGAGIVPLISMVALWCYAVGVIHLSSLEVDALATYLLYLVANVVEVSFSRVRAGQCPTCGAKRKKGMPHP